MNVGEPPPEKPLGFGFLLFIWVGIFSLSFIIQEAFRWSNPLEGIFNALFHSLFLVIFWIIGFLLWSLPIYGLYHWRKWRRYRSQCVLAPVLLLLLATVVSLVFDPPTAAKRFSRFARAPLPADATNLKFELRGGGISDYSDIYYFETTPTEVDRLIREIGLVEDEFYTPSQHSFIKLPGVPDPAEWQGSKRFQKSDDRAHWFHELITDATRTRVYILISCT
jgi:hypothetical protein